MEDLLAYIPIGAIVDYGKGQIVYNPDRPPEGLYLIIDGKIKVSRRLDNGKEVLIDIYQVDEFFGESALLTVVHHAEQATVLSKAKLMNWTASELEDLIVSRPGLAWAMMQMLVRRATGFSQRIDSFASDNIACRLARSLIHLSERFGVLEDDGALRMFSLTQLSLAQYVGTSREIISQHMRQFQRLGYLRYSREYIVLYNHALKGWLRQHSP